jgi:hypothetical protein
MPADITPTQARSETIENLSWMANNYRSGTGAHIIVKNEINRRAEGEKHKRKLLFALLSALGVGLTGLLLKLLGGI